MERQQDIIQAFLTTVESYVKFAKQRTFHHAGESGFDCSLHDIAARQIPLIKDVLKKHKMNLVSFRVQDDFCGWDQKIHHFITTAMTHEFNNSLDHGFIIPKKSGRRVSHEIKFELEARTRNGVLEVELRDNGFGIDMAHVKKVALQAGFQPGLDDHWTDILFRDGISTADQISQSSGRGVGLAAIRALCQEHKGKAPILPIENGSGTRLLLEIPIQAAA